MEDLNMWSMQLEPMQWFIFIIAGLGTGIINTLAGSGSLITLPIFMFFCGLPADVANGTNRIGALLQSMAGVQAFKKSGEVSFKGVEWLVGAAVLGGMVGAGIASVSGKETMEGVIKYLMIVMLIILLVNPKKWIQETTASISNNKKPFTLFIFFLIGIYGGFIQAGVGIFLLAGLVLAARYSLKSSNAIKLLVVFFFNLPAIIIFFVQGQVHIGFGLMMAIFQSVGAVLGVRLITRIPHANMWIHRLLILIVSVACLKLFGVF